MKLPLIGQGTTFGGKQYPDNKKQKLLILETAFEQGFNLVDTGENYEGGLAEEIVGEFIKGKRDKVIVSDKFKAENNYPDKLIKSCENSLKRLQTDYIDLYQIHWPNPEIPVELTLVTLYKLRQQGKIKDFGVCNFTFNEFKNICHLVSSIQTEFSLTNRTILDNILPYCKQHGKSVLGYNIFNQGNLKSKPYLESIAKKHGITIYQVTLAWAISKGLTVLTKTMNLDHLRENIKATKIKLDKEDLDLIDRSYSPPIEISIDKVKVEQQTVDLASKVYTSLDDFLKNANKIHPNPYLMAEEIKKNGLSKPIEVRQTNEGYELIHGSSRYWAWILAFKDRPIPCFVI